MRIKQDILSEYPDSKSLRRFRTAISSPFTEMTYVNSIKLYAQYHQIGAQNFDELLEVDSEKTFDMIEEYLLYLRKKKMRSHSRINSSFAAIRLFYSVNRYSNPNPIDWFALARYKGKERKKMVNDRAYTKEEIQKLLQYADLRMKVAILLMVSSGVRVGGLVGIKLKDMTYIENYKLYKIYIYSSDIDDTYYTFCTPECSFYINLYLESRQIQFGENLNPESPLIRKDFDNSRDLALSPRSIKERIRTLSLRTGLRVNNKEGSDPVEIRRKRHEIMVCHGFRKYFNTICLDSNMKYVVKEILIGHKREQGMDRHYYRPTQDKLLEEYLKVIDALTINDENRLLLENENLKQLQKDSFERLSKLEEKFDQLTSKFIE